jgi:hypothetical protein
VLDECGVARVVQGFGQWPGQADALVELANREQPGIAGKLARRRICDGRRAGKK